MSKPRSRRRTRQHRCQREGCPKYAVKRFCSRSCARTAYLLSLPKEQRAIQAYTMRNRQQREVIARMVARVKALADTEDARLILAWRYGKQTTTVQRYKRRVAQPPSGDAVGQRSESPHLSTRDKGFRIHD